MDDDDFDLSRMTIEDLFRMKEECHLPFARIEIVKKLQTVSRQTLKENTAEQSEQHPSPRTH
jgi:hypothetical protein